MTSIHEESCSKVFHPNTPSCTSYSINATLKSSLATFSSVGPLYIISQISGKDPSTPPSVVFQRIVKDLAHTIGSYGFSSALYSILQCRLRQVLGRHNKSAVFLAGSLSFALGSLLEKESRLPDTLAYQANYTFETIAKLLCYSGYVPEIKNTPVYAFAVAMGLLHYLWKNDPQSLPPIVDKLLSAIIRKDGSQRTNVEAKIVSRLRLNANDKDWTPVDVILGFSWSFFSGFFINQVLGLVVGLYQKKNVVDSFKSSLGNSVGLGLLLGSLSFFSRAGTIISSQTKETHATSAIAGFLAGLSLYFWKSNFTAGYALALACQALAKHLVRAGVVSPIPYFVNILYGLSTGINLYALHFKNDAVRESYRNGYLSKIAGAQDPSHYHTVSKLFEGSV